MDQLTASKLSQLMSFIDAFDNASGSIQRRSKTAAASTTDTDDRRTLRLSGPDSLATTSKESTSSNETLKVEDFDRSRYEAERGYSIADDVSVDLATPDPLDLMPFSGALPKFSEKDLADQAAAVTRRLEEEMARRNALFYGMMRQARARR
jgi:hypothetical protein